MQLDIEIDPNDDAAFAYTILPHKLQQDPHNLKRYPKRQFAKLSAANFSHRYLGGLRLCYPPQSQEVWCYMLSLFTALSALPSLPLCSMKNRAQYRRAESSSRTGPIPHGHNSACAHEETDPTEMYARHLYQAACVFSSIRNWLLCNASLEVSVLPLYAYWSVREMTRIGSLTEHPIMQHPYTLIRGIAN